LPIGVASEIPMVLLGNLTQKTPYLWLANR
jgi:hypothetical protein